MFTGQGRLQVKVKRDEDRSAPATTYLTVEPCPLVHSPPCKSDYQRPDMINLNMTGSHDPDVIRTNKSGIGLEVFCYPAAAADIYEKQNADQMRSTAVSIANNRSEHTVTAFTQTTTRSTENGKISINV